MATRRVNAGDKVPLSTNRANHGGANFDGAVLAGGASKRMGTDKAFIEINGVTLLARVATALFTAGASSVVVVGGDAQRTRSLGLAHIEDTWPRQGPLGGIITALRNTPAETVAVLSCDLLQPSAAAITAVRDALDFADVSVPVRQGQEEWLHAIWRRTSLAVLERAFAEGERAPKRAAARLQIARLEVVDPNWFQDADTPADLPQSVL